MTALREFITVKDKKIVLEVDDQFLENEEVEVIVLPKKDKVEDLSFLEKEIDKGIDSGVSANSHEDIMETLRLKYV
jgi:hypothetical protein